MCTLKGYSNIPTPPFCSMLDSADQRVAFLIQLVRRI